MVIQGVQNGHELHDAYLVRLFASDDAEGICGGGWNVEPVIGLDDGILAQKLREFQANGPMQP